MVRDARADGDRTGTALRSLRSGRPRSAPRRRRGQRGGSSRPTSIGSPASCGCRAPTSTAPPPSTLTSRRPRAGGDTSRFAPGRHASPPAAGPTSTQSRSGSGRRSAASPTTATSRCSPSTASATATAARRRSTTSTPRGVRPGRSARRRAEPRDPEIPVAVVRRAGRARRGRRDRRRALERLGGRLAAAARERVLARSRLGLRGRGGAGFPAARQVGPAARGARRRDLGT